MPSSQDALTMLERSLAAFELDSTWRDLHLIEFDLNGVLNPSLMLDKLFFETGVLPGFSAFSDRYIDLHFLEVKRRYVRLIELEESGKEDELRRLMSDYAYQHFRAALNNGASDEELKLSLQARLYRTLAGIYTEYHAYHLCAKLLGRENVKRSAALDARGVDFVLTTDQGAANIHVIRHSAPALVALSGKITSKKATAAAGIHIVLPYGIHGKLPESTRRIGQGFHVFRESYLSGLLTAMTLYAGLERVLIYESGNLHPFLDGKT
ncbi:hypothetical protein [Deinococcus sp.]|uniref:hypothetical protein n=1 Tax=Deinococcus sp. TaxID=47478 RepID=UPI003B5AC854